MRSFAKRHQKRNALWENNSTCSVRGILRGFSPGIHLDLSRLWNFPRTGIYRKGIPSRSNCFAFSKRGAKSFDRASSTARPTRKHVPPAPALRYVRGRLAPRLKQVSTRARELRESTASAARTRRCTLSMRRHRIYLYATHVSCGSEEYIQSTYQYQTTRVAQEAGKTVRLFPHGARIHVALAACPLDCDASRDENKRV